MRYRAMLGLALAAAIVSQARAKESVWIEGEAATKHTFKKHNWYDGVNKSLLSGGDWLSHYSGEAPGEATYRFAVKEGGQYTWWLRCNPVLVRQHYSLDGGDPVEMDLTTDVREQINLVDKPDHRFIGWIKVGRFNSSPGSTRSRSSFRRRSPTTAASTACAL